MKISNNNPNIMLSQNNKTSFKKSDFIAKKKAYIAHIEHDEDAYSKFGQRASIGALVGIGLALVFRNNFQNLTKNVSNGLKKCFGIHSAKEIRMTPNVTGPNFDNAKGKTAISDAWDVYINDIEERISSHKNYLEIFANNTEQLDKLEKVAKKRYKKPFVSVA